MKRAGRILSLLLVLCVLFGMTAVPALASTFTDAHGNEIELDDSLEAYSEVTLLGADDAARRGETNLGDLWTDALRWFAVSGKINEYFEEDDVTAGNTALAVDADHVVALWNGGNLRADIPAGKFGAVELAEALPYPNKVAVVYMTGAQLKEALEAASQGLPYNEGSAAACASFMQAAGVKYTVDLSVPYAQGEAYGKNWFRAASLGRVTVTEVNGAALDEAATYAVITSNANFNGMDSSYIFKEAAEANEKSTITTAVVRDVVWMYISEALENVVKEETYAAPQGRVKTVFTDAHGNTIELNPTVGAYSSVKLIGADDAARKAETNLGDLWTDALRWFAVSGRINEYFEEDDVTAGNTALAVDADHVVALWNGGNLRADVEIGNFGEAEVATVLPYPNKVAVVYMTGAQLKEALEAASQGLPYNEGSAAACASFMQAAGVKYTVDLSVPYAQGEAYGKNWFKAASLGRVTVTEVNGAALDETATYAVITSNANFNGMDSSYIFKEAAEANEKSAITTAVVRDVVWMYIRDVLGGTVGDDYAAPAGRILLNGAEQTEPAAVFADVDATAYYYDAVLWAVEKGITAGTSATTFSPADTCTRAQMVTFLWRAVGSPEPAAAESPFADVTDPGAYYYKAVLWAVEKGITTGTTATAFDPNGTVSRAQAVTFLYRLAGEPETSAENGFADVGDNAYYRQAVLWAAEKGVTTGKTADAFAPDDPCLRGQIVTFLYRDLK